MSRLVNVSKPEHHDVWVDPSRVITVYTQKVTATTADAVIALDGGVFHRFTYPHAEVTDECRRLVGLLYPFSLAAYDLSLKVGSPQPMVPANP